MSASVLTAHRVTVAAQVRPHGLDILPMTSLEVRAGSSVVVVGDPGGSHVALALALGGRLSGLNGLVTIDQQSDPAILQRLVALVDVPGVSEPDPGLKVPTVVGEELAMAHHDAGPRDVRRWLEQVGMDYAAALRLHELKGPERVRMMMTLAALRQPSFMVLTLPERLGGLPYQWAETIEEINGRGIGVVVTASRGIAPHLSEDLVRPDQLFTVGNAVDVEEDAQ